MLKQIDYGALEILRQTFPAASTAKAAQPGPMSTASMMNHSDAGFVSTESDTRRLGNGVAPPVPVVKQRNIASCACRGASKCPLIPELISSALNRLRTRPQSDSDEDSHFDPSPPASPTNRSDGNNLARNDVPSVQPRSDRPDTSTHGSPAPNGEDLTEDQDLDEELLFQDADLAKFHEFTAKWTEIFSLEHSWNESSNLCVQFATESRELAQSLNRSKIPSTNIKTNPAPTVPRPPPCRPP